MTIRRTPTIRRPTGVVQVPVSVPVRPPARRPFVTVAVAALALGLALFFGRHLLDSLLDRVDYQRAVHTDRSAADAGVRAEVRPQVLLVYRNRDGRRVRVLVDEARFSTFVREQVRNLEATRIALRSEVPRLTGAATEPVFAGMRARVAAYADWYFGWGTAYRMLGQATISAVTHGLTPGVMDLKDAVAYDLQRYVGRHYEQIVLRPELSDPALRRAYADTLESLHQRFLDSVAGFESGFQAYVAANSRRLEADVDRSRVRLTLDWDDQVRKLVVAGHDGTGVEPAAGLALMGGGIVAGRVVGAAVGKTAAELLLRRAAVPAAEGLSARLAAPVATRAMASLAGVSIGAAGGPVGAAVGGAAGLGVDYLLNEAVAALSRDSFEKDVGATLDLQAIQWRRLMADSLGGAVDAWYNDLIQLVAAYG